MAETLRSMSVAAPKCKEKFGAERNVKFERSFGGNLDGAVAAYGADTVYSIFEQQATVKTAAVVRAHLEAADEAGQPKYMDEQAIQAGLDYIPSTGAVRKPKDPFAGILSDVNSGKMTKDEALKILKAKLAEG